MLVDTDGDYIYTDETALVLNTDYWLGPWDRLTAAVNNEQKPGRFIELHPDSTIVTVFPAQRRAAQVTAQWGWPLVPHAIERATCHLVALLRIETQRAITARGEAGDVLEATKQAQDIIVELSRVYKRSTPY